MPIYQYKCQNINCNFMFDLYFEKFEDSEPMEICPKCADMGATRIITPCTFKLEGDGWAKDGYTKSNK